MTEQLTVLVAARDEEGRIGRTIEALREQFPAAAIVIADDGSRDQTAAIAEAAGARVIRLERRGKGQALTLAEQQLDPGPLLLCDADVRGRPAPARGVGGRARDRGVLGAHRRRLRAREEGRARPDPRCAAASRRVSRCPGSAG